MNLIVSSHIEKIKEKYGFNGNYKNVRFTLTIDVSRLYDRIVELVKNVLMKIEVDKNDTMYSLIPESYVAIAEDVTEAFVVERYVVYKDNYPIDTSHLKKLIIDAISLRFNVSEGFLNNLLTELKNFDDEILNITMDALQTELSLGIDKKLFVVPYLKEFYIIDRNGELGNQFRLTFHLLKGAKYD